MGMDEENKYQQEEEQRGEIIKGTFNLGLILDFLFSVLLYAIHEELLSALSSKYIQDTDPFLPSPLQSLGFKTPSPLMWVTAITYLLAFGLGLLQFILNTAVRIIFFKR